MTRIFISYRREDCAAHAGRLYDTLSTLFGERNVFMDVDTIELGVDFVDRIEQAIAGSDVVLALIGDDWLTARDRHGNRRIDAPDDFVRLELSSALAKDDVRVIPVLVEGATMPPASELPDALTKLARRNGIELTDTRWRSDTAVLIKAIEPVLGDASGPDAQPDGRASSARRSAWTDWVWVLPAFVSLGGLALVYAGLRARERQWFVAGVLYTIPLAVNLVWSSLHPEEHPLDWIFISLFFGAWAASLIHVLLIRPRYVARVRSLSGVGGPAGG
jgi:hypothetical protein